MFKTSWTGFGEDADSWEPEWAPVGKPHLREDLSEKDWTELLVEMSELDRELGPDTPLHCASCKRVPLPPRSWSDRQRTEWVQTQVNARNSCHAAMLLNSSAASARPSSSRVVSTENEYAKAYVQPKRRRIADDHGLAPQRFLSQPPTLDSVLWLFSGRCVANLGGGWCYYLSLAGHPTAASTWSLTSESPLSHGQQVASALRDQLGGIMVSPEVVSRRIDDDDDGDSSHWTALSKRRLDAVVKADPGKMLGMDFWGRSEDDALVVSALQCSLVVFTGQANGAITTTRVTTLRVGRGRGGVVKPRVTCIKTCDTLSELKTQLQQSLPASGLALDRDVVMVFYESNVHYELISYRDEE